MWIEDSRDGGASVWFRGISGQPVERWLDAPHKSSQVPFNWREPSQDQVAVPPIDVDATIPAQGQRLHAYCHCRGIEFYITRPDRRSVEAKSPFPDALIAYNSGKSAENPKNIPWWLSRDRQRYTASTCACNSCRRASGFDLAAWAFVPAADIVLPSEDAFSGQLFGTAKRYRSSSHVERWFCSSCGANAFWIGDERPSLIDVAVGLFHAKTGARAEEWLDWVTERVSFIEEAHHRALISAFQGGLRDWARIRA